MRNLIKEHHDLCIKINNIYTKKNKAYGNSFGETFEKLGIISAVTRISDKYNRLATLSTNPDYSVDDEPIVDTLLDMANYCLMTVMEINNEKEKLNNEIVS